jgi:hypothetical protein
MSARLSLAFCATAAIALVAAVPAQAFADKKFMHPSACAAYGPDTTAAEIEYSPVGIYNPGTQIEKVVCPIDRDQEAKYVTGNLIVGVYYRAFAPVDSRLTCTLTVGSTSMQSTAVFTHTKAGPMVKSGGRTALQLDGATQDPAYSTVPVSVVCALSPKTSLAGLFVQESGATQTP